MPLITLIRELAAAIRAGNWKLVAEKFAEIIRLIGGVLPSPNPVALNDLIHAAREAAAMGTSDAQRAGNVADQLDALATEMEGQGEDGTKAMANGELVKKLFQLIVKLLPLLLAGL